MENGCLKDRGEFACDRLFVQRIGTFGVIQRPIGADRNSIVSLHDDAGPANAKGPDPRWHEQS
jgi:hypothetical protein